MTYPSKFDRHLEKIEAARIEVAAAQEAYSKGRVGASAVNKANRALADAHFEAQECYGGNVPDKRG